MWVALVNWVTVSLVVTVLIGLGASVLSMTPPHYAIAQVCFSISALILLSRVGWWIVFEQRPDTKMFERGLFAFVIFGAVGILWSMSLMWVSNLQVDGKPQKARTTAGTTTTQQVAPFVVTVGPCSRTAKRNAIGNFVLVFEKHGQYTMIPVNVWLYVSLTNTQPTQSMVDAYSLEMKTKAGNWVTLSHVDSRPYLVYFVGNGLQRAKLVELVKLDDLLSLRWLHPKENVRGWTSFTYPEGGDQEDLDFIFRFNIKDAAGVTFVSDELNVGQNKGIQGALFTVRPQEFDLDLTRAGIKYASN